MNRTFCNFKKIFFMTCTAASLSFISAAEKIDLDKLPAYNGDDLGLTLNEDSAVFKCWAPIAKNVKVLFFNDSENLAKPVKSVKMEKDAENQGVWILKTTPDSCKYYQYEISNPGKKTRVCDIWAKAASPESKATQITDINKDPAAIPQNLKFDKEWGTKEGYYNPFGNNGEKKTSYTDAVIFEMHIRDWSLVEVKDTTGKFKEIADGDKVISHLKDLGVTHVQLLPSFEYAETNSSQLYNWGYNPYNYNVPEGRYVSTGYKDGTQAVNEMRYMIGKLHENGIAVTMDVVYNHTSGTGDNSLYDLTVPDYFYRLNADGSHSSGSGCGNEVATNRSMVRKFVVDSVKHWMLDYHVNGFRFDLMGLQERETMAAVYNALYEIDPNVMVYGEPWTGGKSLVKFGCSKGTIDLITDDESVNGVGCFNDDFRDAVKGSVFSPAEGGFVQGNAAKFGNVTAGLTGSVRGKGGFTKRIGRSINYVECHDNHTLFDKLAVTELGKNQMGNLFEMLNDAQLEKIKKEDKLAAAIIFLAQGTPFINGGQEFMRTKNGNSNSYIAGNKINGIDISIKERFSDVYNTYKALIAFRKANSGSFGANEDAEAEMIQPGLIKYTAGKYTVYFNGSDESKKIKDSGKTVIINEKDGTYSKSVASAVPEVAAKSFVILEK